MKITILSPAYPLRGGIANFAGSLFKELNKEFSVNVISFKKQYPSFLFPGKTQNELDPESEIINAESLIDSTNPFNWREVGKRIKLDKPDLLIIQFWLPFFAPCLKSISKIVKKNSHTKILTICHNIIPHEKRPGDIFLTKLFFKYVDKFILLSETVKDELLKIKKNAKYKIIHHPVYNKFGDEIEKDKAKEYLKIDTEKLLLFFGFIRDYKGLDVLLEAISLIDKKENIKLLVAGEYYSNETKYKKLISELDIDNSLILKTDFIPASEVKYYFSAADVVILPYKTASQSGIAQIAMNFNKSVIASNVGGLSEIIIDNQTGLLVEKENPEILAEAILKFYNHKLEEKYDSFIKMEKEKYSWLSFSNQLINFVKT
ncbi:MAG: glycosyl transferase family 1 [Ignavibacteriales bacterium CG_4_9_14_3_um_filter_30_11]|nr:MAG: glycosyl transferase family 1 [Ignavibacteriales bacterium CG_4_9_14_3_um_filter_30_11]